MPYDIVPICAETYCITTDLLSFIFDSLMEQLTNNAHSSVTTKLVIFKIARWRREDNSFSGFHIPKRVDD